MGETRSEATAPPNLRDAAPGESERCGNCKMFDAGVCWGYGNYEVRADQVCDSWAADGGADADQDTDDWDMTLEAAAARARLELLRLRRRP